MKFTEVLWARAGRQETAHCRSLTQLDRKLLTGVLLQLTGTSSRPLATVHYKEEKHTGARKSDSLLQCPPAPFADKSLMLSQQLAIGEMFIRCSTRITKQSKAGWTWSQEWHINNWNTVKCSSYRKGRINAWSFPFMFQFSE